MSNGLSGKQLNLDQLLEYILFGEVSPPGWSGSVSAMKQHHPELSKGKDKNPYALAWHMHNKGNKPHYKPQPSNDSNSKTKPVKKKKYR